MIVSDSDSNNTTNTNSIQNNVLYCIHSCCTVGDVTVSQQSGLTHDCPFCTVILAADSERMEDRT